MSWRWKPFTTPIKHSVCSVMHNECVTAVYPDAALCTMYLVIQLCVFIILSCICSYPTPMTLFIHYVILKTNLVLPCMPHCGPGGLILHLTVCPQTRSCIASVPRREPQRLWLIPHRQMTTCSIPSSAQESRSTKTSAVCALCTNFFFTSISK